MKTTVSSSSNYHNLASSLTQCFEYFTGKFFQATATTKHKICTWRIMSFRKPLIFSSKVINYRVFLMTNCPIC